MGKPTDLYKARDSYQKGATDTGLWEGVWTLPPGRNCDTVCGMIKNLVSRGQILCAVQEQRGNVEFSSPQTQKLPGSVSYGLPRPETLSPRQS